ncbi:MAG: hypothetical protein BGO37_06845 [Cellulomonas sp. 73-92]|uniref:ScbR family autoregulator-binding transcription factor n=1 Tax=Cellulomonas sp. 73-92 TaxID=1895740 RepID=UPI0009291D3D|nr:ScbR family autoregulator-binding transcription factor [Cellulomonas sp. 73-92]OJV75948.1 MAG: hypothetical protein BGO37_06845 [Cellulomonas sp. 73-92]
MTQRTEQRERTRAAILDTAAAQFEERGYLGASIRDISEALGLTVGAIFFHFKTKESIATELIASYYDEWDDLIREANRRPSSALEALVWLSMRVADRYQHDIHIRAAVRLIRDHSVISASLPTPYVDWVNVATAFLQRAQKDGELAEHAALDIDQLAYQLVCTWFGNQHISNDLTGRADLKERIGQMWTVYLPVLTGRPADDLPFAPIGVKAAGAR